MLAIDTATEFCSVALLSGERALGIEEHAGQSHSARVLPMVDRVLAQAGLDLAQVDAIAFGAGPGAFTGLRIACSVAQGLGYGVDRPLLAVGHLDALAWLAFRQAPQARRIGVAIDARMREAYWAAYEGDATAQRALAPPALVAAGELDRALREQRVEAVAGNALEAFAEEIRLETGVRRLAALRVDATVIARCGRLAFARGEAVPAALAAPLYVRDRVAQTIEERAAGRAGAPGPAWLQS